jgi:pantoate--beta-alanine ligase
VGFVPTMGALHEGHLSLLRAARRDTQVRVVSIFVNPLQFGPREDFARYPRTMSHDVAMVRRIGCEVVFAPSREQIYPPGFATSVEVSGPGERFEGAARPGHFRGVATVVATLLGVVQPTDLYLGQKDYQQALLLSRMVRDLQLPVRVHIRPTVREADGLAMSSRNRYLSAEERAQATAISRALRLARQRIRAGERRAAAVVSAMRRIIQAQPAARVDYLAVADASTLEPLSRLAGRRVVVLAAVRVGATRLIDNVLVVVP